MKQKENQKHQLITLHEPKSVISEKFRGIRSNLLFSSADETIKGIVVTAEKPSAGKSTIASNLAITYAQAGYKTLIIDGDMRKPTLHYIFNKMNNHGLSSTIINNIE
ncbi:capsular biosynthesis protein, partial [Staphylococcus condimenti]